jgi:hypothetical protein
VTVAECDSPLPVPVTVTMNVPDVAVRSMQDRVETPEVVVLLRATAPTLRVQVKPTAGETLFPNVTVPLKPLRPVTVIVDEALLPRKTVTFVGLAVTVKSWMVKTTVVECVIPLLVPVTLTL